MFALLGAGCVPDVKNEEPGCAFSNCIFFAFNNFQNADVAIGQPDLVTATAPGAATAATVSTPEGASWLEGTNLYIPDAGENRILGFSSIPTVSGANANFVIGQGNSFITNTAVLSASGLSFPTTVQESGGQFFVGDLSHIRILIYNSPPTSSVSADIAVGQPDLVTANTGCSQSTMSTGRSVYVAGSKLLIPDTNNNRVLIWNHIPSSSGTIPDLVLGQTSFTSCAANPANAATASTMNAPMYVWSDGTRVAVTDNNNSRVLIWNSFPTSNGQPADLVLGQGTGATAFTNTTSSTGQGGMSGPVAIESNGLEFLVSDSGNNRILIWNEFPTQIAQLPDRVLGQADFIGSAANAGGPVAANTFSSPFGLRLIPPNLLVVTDFSNNRVLIFHSL